MNLSDLFFIFSYAIGLVILLLIIGYLIARFKARGRIVRALNMSLFLISLPRKIKREEGEAARPAKEIIGVMEQLYNSLSTLRETKAAFIYGQPYLVFEIATPQIGEEIAFYLAVPRRYEAVIEKQIHGFYPSASVEKVEDYNIFNPQGVSSGSYLKLSQIAPLPIKTYLNLETDPLNEIVNTLSKLEEENEGAAVQIVFRPAPANWKKFGLSLIKEMNQGQSLKGAQAQVSRGLLFKFFDLVSDALSSPKKAEEQLAKSEKSAVNPLDEEILKAIKEKLSKAAFESNIRLIVSAQDQNRADDLLNHLEGAFVQFSTPHLNSFKPVRLKGRKLKKLIYQFSFRLFDKRQKVILNTEELTSVFHLPNITLETPKVRHLKAEPSSPPANLPKQGIILGKNLYRGIETVVRLQEDDRRRHLYVIGQTGTGKSTFLKNMIVQDIKQGQGLAVLDPHGDLVEDVLSLIPEERSEDVVFLNPADLERPIGLNMLEYDLRYPEQKTFLVNELINIFDKLYDLKQTGGPMFEQYTRNALLLLMDDPSERFTLMEVPKVLADASFRRHLLAKCRNLVVKDFWEKEAEKAGGEAALQNMVPYITSKFNVFVANDYMRPIIGQAQSSIDFRQVIDQGKIFLVNLSKGRLGEANSALLGLIVTGKFLVAAFSRVDLPEEERRDYYLYMDEFQNFSTQSIATILSEARKYRLGLIIAHQFIGQLTDPIKEAVFGNVGSMVAFRVGAEDAEFLVKQFEPVFDQNDLINVDNFNAYIKLMIRGQTSKPFSLMTYRPAKGDDPQRAERIRQISRLKYGRAKEDVEKEILARWQSRPPVSSEASETESDMPVK